MSATLEPAYAGDVYWVLLEPHPRRRGPRALRAALDLWCAMSGGMLELTAAGDIVLRRREDGGEELRIYAGPPDSAAPMLHQLRADLDELTPEEFRRAWSIA